MSAHRYRDPEIERAMEYQMRVSEAGARRVAKKRSLEEPDSYIVIVLPCTCYEHYYYVYPMTPDTELLNIWDRLEAFLKPTGVEVIAVYHKGDDVLYELGA